MTKDVTRGRTFSNLHEVTGKARQEEIARMLGGKSDSALKLAASLLKEVAAPRYTSESYACAIPKGLNSVFVIFVCFVGQNYNYFITGPSGRMTLP